MARIQGLCGLGLALGMLGCGSLFGMDNSPPATVAYLDPTVSFPSGLDCSAGGDGPLAVTWSVKPVMLTAGGTGIASEFSSTENLVNVGGTPTDCYYQPANTVSESSGTGLQAGLWQVTLTHNIPGFTNPLVCTRQLANGPNALTFVFGVQGAACQ